MKIVITDITRMDGEKVCIAGLGDGGSVRLHSPQPYVSTLRHIGGLLPGQILDLSWRKEQKPRLPHVEDGTWSNPKRLQRMGYREFLRRLEAGTFLTIGDAFGEIHDKGSGGNIAFRPDRGTRSLATLKVTSCEVYVDQYDKPRIRLHPHGGNPVQGIPLNDLTFLQHFSSCALCGSAHVGEANVRIGLGRPFAPTEGRPESCWLQVNGMFPIQDDWPHYYQE